MQEISIFIDESGDFGEYIYHSPYYIVTMVFHDQSNDISSALDSIEKKHIEDITDATGKLSKLIGTWVKNNLETLLLPRKQLPFTFDHL